MIRRFLASRWAGEARYAQWLIRVTILASAVAAVGCTRAAGDSIPLLEYVIIGLGLFCAAQPDSHTGLAVVMLVGLSWGLAVDDVATPWSIGAAISLAVFHTSMAAASVAPIAASWTRSMSRRWARRLIVVAALSIPAWAVTAAVDRPANPSSPALLAGSLLILAGFALWARQGSLRTEAAGSRR